MTDFNEMLKKAIQERLDFINRNREWMVEMFVAQHGFKPDEMQLIEKSEADGSVRVWVEKRGEYAELTQLRAEVVKLRDELADAEAHIISLQESLSDE